MRILAEIVFTLPLTDPILIFSVVLFIILFAPLLLDRIKVPHIIGLIVAGIIVSPYGLNILTRDESIVLFGTVGLLYIMFLAGLEIDLEEFKKNSINSLILGVLGFIVPITIGYLLSYYWLNYSVLTSLLLGSTFASHTLVTYPIISKYGIANNRAVTITVGATMVTDILTLLVLAVVVGMAEGNISASFWYRLSISVIIASAIIVFVFPLIARWFFKKVDDGISQYIFVLAMVFMGAFLAELAGIEGIIGAFLAGLSLNKFIPHNSPLMNRIGFVGNAIFIPFFLVGVGMLVDIKAAFTSLKTIEVAGIMIGGALLGKYLASAIGSRIFRLSKVEGNMIFGLSTAQAAATLATVLVGYGVIIGENMDGTPIRLLDENILNGSILLILVSCTFSSFLVERDAKKIASNEGDISDEKEVGDSTLIAVNDPMMVNSLVELGILFTSKKNKDQLLAINVLEEKQKEEADRKASEKMLNAIENQGASCEIPIKTINRFDSNVAHALLYTVREHKISDIILGVTPPGQVQNKKEIGSTTQSILLRTEETVYVYNPTQPFNTLKKIVVIVNNNAEEEEGFSHWLKKMFILSKESGLPLTFYATSNTERSIKTINQSSSKPLTLAFNQLVEWNDFLIVGKDLSKNDLLIFISSREGHLSFHKGLKRIPYYLSRYFQENSSITIYPQQRISFSKLGDLQNEEGSLLDFLAGSSRLVSEKAGNLIHILSPFRHGSEEQNKENGSDDSDDIEKPENKK